MTDKEKKKRANKTIAKVNNTSIRNAIKARGYKLSEVATGIGVDKASLTQYLEGDMSLTKVQSVIAAGAGVVGLPADLGAGRGLLLFRHQFRCHHRPAHCRQAQFHQGRDVPYGASRPERRCED